MLNKDLIDDKKAINNIRALGIDMIQEAGSGHPGIVLGAAPTLYTLFTRHLMIEKDDPMWINRDRFIMSSGHGSALLYSCLFMAGVIPNLDDLKKFRKYNSITPGHLEYYKTPGVDMSTGPLGQGFATGVGMAMAERFFYSHFAKNMIYPINHYTYVFCGDGDLMEGISYEAASLAGNLKLHKLIVLYDNNGISLDGTIDKTYSDDILKRFNSACWNVIEVNDGENVEEIDNAIKKAKELKNAPTIISIKNTIGKYSIKQGTNKIHGGILSSDDYSNIKKLLDVRDIPFTVSSEVPENFQKMIAERVDEKYRTWCSDYNLLADDVQEELNKIKNNNISLSMKDTVYTYPESKLESPRVTSGKILDSICSVNTFVMSGSSDVSSSTMTYLPSSTDFSATNYLGKNVWYGVREGAMGAIMSGLTLSGIRNFGSTFLAFSDYMKPSIRLASLMNIPNIYIFTHDSVFIGEDGPTHQPVEQLISLRSIPNLEVFRPYDANEVLGTYKAVLMKKSGPSAIILGRNEVTISESTSINDVSFGAYIVKYEEKNLQGIIIATGSEVALALNVAQKLLENGIDIRVVSMPSIERFNIQKEEYKIEILPSITKTFVIEAGSSYSWYQFVLNKDYLFTIDNFGFSASEESIRSHFFYDTESITKKIKKLFD